MFKIIKVFLIFLIVSVVSGCKEEIIPIFDEAEMAEVSEAYAMKLVEGDIRSVYDSFAELSRKSAPYENIEAYVNKIFQGNGEFQYVISTVFTESRNPLTEVPTGNAVIRLKYDEGIIICTFGYDETGALTGMGLMFELR
jgi:hypothetical protein